jgi:hypothetical protein
MLRIAQTLRVTFPQRLIFAASALDLPSQSWRRSCPRLGRLVADIAVENHNAPLPICQPASLEFRRCAPCAHDAHKNSTVSCR